MSIKGFGPPSIPERAKPRQEFVVKGTGGRIFSGQCQERPEKVRGGWPFKDPPLNNIEDRKKKKTRSKKK